MLESYMKNTVVSKKKNELRKKFTSLRNNYPLAVQEEESIHIYRNLVPFLTHCSTVGIYASMKSEVRTNIIHNYLNSMGINILYPAIRIYGRHKTMVFTKINDPKHLNFFKHGFPQPRKFQTWPRDSIDMLLIPGIVFDHYGNRIGYGSGHYDKYLSKFSGNNIGICYDFQLTDAVPTDTHDRKMDKIVTNKRIIDILS